MFHSHSTRATSSICGESSTVVEVASSPDCSQILSHSRGGKSGEGLGSLLRHGLKMVDTVSTQCGLGFYAYTS